MSETASITFNVGEGEPLESALARYVAKHMDIHRLLFGAAMALDAPAKDRCDVLVSLAASMVGQQKFAGRDAFGKQVWLPLRSFTRGEHGWDILWARS